MPLTVIPSMKYLWNAKNTKIDGNVISMFPAMIIYQSGETSMMRIPKSPKLSGNFDWSRK